MKMKKVLMPFLTACLSLVAAELTAVTCTWTGGGDGVSWSDKANWDMDPFTDWGHTVRFTNSVSVVIDAAGKDAGGAGRWPAKHVVEAGCSVYYCRGIEDLCIYSSTPTFDIAKDACLVSSNDFTYFLKGSFYKKGEGLLRQCGSGFDGETVWHNLYVEAGSLEFVKTATGGRFSCTNMVISAGASVLFDGVSTDSKMIIAIEEGAKLKFNGVTSTIANLTGGGEIEGGADRTVLTIAQTKPVATYFTGGFGNIWYRFGKPAEGDFFPSVVQGPDQLKDACLDDGTGLRFKKGVGVFDVGSLTGYHSGVFDLRDEDEGGDVTVRTTYEYPGTLIVKGPGNLWLTKSTTVYGSQYRGTGWVRVSGVGTRVVFGGDTEAHNIDLSGQGMAGIYCEEGAAIEMDANGSTRLLAAVPIVSEGPIGFYRRGTGSYRYENIHVTATNKVDDGAGVEYAGGELEFSRYVGGGKAAISMNNRWFTGAKVHGPKTPVAADPRRVLPMPTGIEFAGDNGWYTTFITGGELYRAGGGGHKNHFMLGGRTYFGNGADWSATAGALADGGHPKAVFDGGTAVLYNRTGADIFYFPNDDALYDVYVSTNGGRIVAQAAADNVVKTYRLTRPLVATNGMDGGLSFYGHGVFTLGHPMQLKGPIGFMDGCFNLEPTLFADDVAAPFGEGDLLLRNSMIQYVSSVTDRQRLDLATGANAALRYRGGAGIRFRPADGSPSQDVTAGRVVRDGKGSVLFLRLSASETIGDGVGSSFTVADGLELAASGATKLPIVVGAMKEDRFATYDATDGIKPFANYAENDFTQGGNSIVALTVNKTLSANATVAGLCSQVGWMTLTIGSGVTLRVGNGTDPAMIMLGVVGGIVGDGTLDFGTNEGIFVANNTTGTNPHEIKAKIVGSGGVSYVGTIGCEMNLKFAVSNGANDYTGGTYVNVATVWADAPGCFGSGTVDVGGGVRAGGAVVFTKSGTWANGFRVAGHGGTGYKEYLGALSFEQPATLTGPVELAEETRMSALDGVTGTISGAVSGDRLQIYNQSGTSGGTIALTGHNTYTGGTEVVAAGIAVKESDGFGTGDVTIDGSLLEFVNTAPIDIANDIEGVGTVRFSGLDTGSVKLSGWTRDLSLALDLAGQDLTLTTLPDWVTTIGNSTGTRCTITVPDGAKADLTGHPASGLEKVDVVLGTGATLDLGGQNLTVRRFTGDRNAVTNGTLTELKPVAGIVIIVR